MDIINIINIIDKDKRQLSYLLNFCKDNNFIIMNEDINKIISFINEENKERRGLFIAIEGKFKLITLTNNMFTDEYTKDLTVKEFIVWYKNRKEI